MTRRDARPLLFVVCLLPLAWLVYGVLADRLGANPIEAITQATGLWTLRLLVLGLLMTPLRRLFGWQWPLRLRRMLGLFAFFYASLHLLTYLWLDQFFDWGEIGRDLLKRPFITLGMTAWLLLVPLAMTSTRGMMRRLGRHWKALHRLVYLVAPLGALHFLLLVKADWREPLLYLLLTAGLLMLRLPRVAARRPLRG
ncbi:protein-methionine-sulfoxide reductase heme-binding subunit MsrQ [Thiohalobacter sp. IOR34]|uniref:sulfite oxidase heme-binding subunit YedZ n=1 Tax=Thiohalobacter sp. IOR34 TaxID=3057176 RepID=UPI0025B14A7D|nr:protein-methionine-sulfoxide reductase heme-binding subunit MsrQ [Thiohalobacter sp. IOR34]WJW76209.1 protein-methionine-sulfoxide reductase heme-binding subunit MsrQ [Thiohalobacter sp. IOR34]